MALMLSRLPGTHLIRGNRSRRLDRAPRPGRLAMIAAAVGAAISITAAACSATGSPGGSLATGGGPAGTGASAGTGAGARLSWHSCTQVPRMQCARLRVPLDYRHPDGRKITLALSEMPATAPAGQRQGVLLVNPGGPGASGLSLAASVASAVSPSVAADYDIVGFDPRGVGSSVPALTCDASFFQRPRPPYPPANNQAEQVQIDRSKTYAADCEKKFGWLLPYMTSQDSARDLDSIRVAL